MYTICAVRDRAADAYGRPIFVASAAVGIRSFQDEVNRASSDNQLNQHPDDFDLYELGHFDDNSGIFTLHDQPNVLMLGKNAVRS